MRNVSVFCRNRISQFRVKLEISNVDRQTILVPISLWLIVLSNWSSDCQTWDPSGSGVILTPRTTVWLVPALFWRFLLSKWPRNCQNAVRSRVKMTADLYKKIREPKIRGIFDSTAAVSVVILTDLASFWRSGTPLRASPSAPSLRVQMTQICTNGARSVCRGAKWRRSL